MSQLKILTKGETVNLCLPTLRFAKGDIWYKWLNKPIMIKNLSSHYENLDNTKHKQERFFILNKNKRVMRVISTKNNIYKGIVSLSNIDQNRKTCEIAIISDPTIDPELAPFAGLEAIALLSEYAFHKMKMKEIIGAGNLNLKRWQQRMELLGYKFNFFKEDSSRSKNDQNKLEYCISCSYDDYKFLKKKRGKLWDSLKKMKLRIYKLPKTSFQDIVKRIIYKK